MFSYLCHSSSSQKAWRCWRQLPRKTVVFWFRITSHIRRSVAQLTCGGKMNGFHIVRSDCARNTIPITPDLVRVWNGLFTLNRLLYTRSGICRFIVVSFQFLGFFPRHLPSINIGESLFSVSRDFSRRLQSINIQAKVRFLVLYFVSRGLLCYRYKTLNWACFQFFKGFRRHLLSMIIAFFLSYRKTLAPAHVQLTLNI